MVDPISTGASAVTVVDRVAAAAGWLWRRLLRRQAGSVDGGRNEGLEIRPMSYRIDLSGRVPRVEVQLWAINYLPHPLELRELKVTLFGGAAAVNNVPLAVEVTIKPRSSFLVHCERALADSEARALHADIGHSSFGGSVNLLARGNTRGKEISFRAHAQVVEGSVYADPLLRPN